MRVLRESRKWSTKSVTRPCTFTALRKPVSFPVEYPSEQMLLVGLRMRLMHGFRTV